MPKRFTHYFPTLRNYVKDLPMKNREMSTIKHGMDLLKQKGVFSSRRGSELELSACGVTSAGINQLSVVGKLENLSVVKCTRLDASEIGSTVGRAVYAGHRHQGLPGAAHIGLLPS